MNFRQHPDCQEISLHRPRAGRTWQTRMEPRCHGDLFSVGNSATQQTAQNRQTTVQAGTSATVTGAGNTGISNNSGVAVNGNRNNVSITTADPAIVQSALDTNSLIATEALATYDHLVTGQTAGQLQAQAESQNADDHMFAASIGQGGGNSSQPAVAVDNAPTNEGNTGTGTATKVLLYLSIAAAAATVIYIGWEFTRHKKKV